MFKPTQYFSTKATPPSQPIPGSAQVPNSAGGYVWSVDDWTRLDRFLILGTEGGTYYISERKLSLDNCDALVALSRPPMDCASSPGSSRSRMPAARPRTIRRSSRSRSPPSSATRPPARRPTPRCPRSAASAPT